MSIWIIWMETKLQTDNPIYIQKHLKLEQSDNFNGLEIYITYKHMPYIDIALDNHKVGITIKATENGAYYPRVTERTIMRISAIKIPNTISFTFMFCSHIFRRIEVPELLKSCAWKRKYKIICYHSIIKIQKLYWKQKSEHVNSKEFSFCYQVEREENGTGRSHKTQHTIKL